MRGGLRPSSVPLQAPPVWHRALHTGRSAGRGLPVTVIRHLHLSQRSCFSVGEIQVGPGLNLRTLGVHFFPYYPKIISMEVYSFLLLKD